MVSGQGVSRTLTGELHAQECYLMEVVDTTQINSFASQPMQANVPQAEEAVFILTASQLKSILQEAIQPLQDEVMQLRAMIERQDEKIAALATTQEHDVSRICLDIAYDRQRLARLEQPSHAALTAPTAGEAERIERIEKLCTDAPGHMISLPELRGRLGIDKAVLSRLLKRIDRDRFYLKKSSTDKRIRYLCLRPVVR